MNFNALVEYNKYTLALAAACFAYALEKFVPMPTARERFLVLFTLVMFFVCAVLGVIIFAAATAAQHPKKAGSADAIARLIGPLGMAHTALLVLGLLGLGYLVYERVMDPPKASKPSECCAPPASAK